MYKLTERRFAKVEQFLEEARSELINDGVLNYNILEREMRDSLNLGFQELKDIMIDIVKRYPRYRLVALYYMQHQNAGMGPVSEFQPTLAKEYGLDGHYGGQGDRDAIKAKFWKDELAELRSDAG
ncbi:hypothetical protein [Rhodopirellula sp. MGV]|uniref:hypothetical protein n=1 Tax=Rhodopirellula sp. MGV TaxID=2023130 RepID=UPI000B973B25|nr:hypothetical protein [Rhodopirellula sp. MGV]OYP38044.1 hypothetical protein CGZ80_03680 [Rhodopirellula sp. MGV]PNY36156.1 hypothetical protein C2E31_14590 [Rhodopirellula baltica]